jgi:hypothetical protein
VVQQQQVRGRLLGLQGELLELERRQGVLLELEQQRLAWPRWHRRNRQRL